MTTRRRPPLPDLDDAELADTLSLLLDQDLIAIDPGRAAQGELCFTLTPAGAATVAGRPLRSVT
jgi:hypothetical protein